MVMHVRGTAWPQGEGKLTELRTGYSPGSGGVAELLEGSGDAAQLRCLALEPSRAEGRLLEEKAFVCVCGVCGGCRRTRPSILAIRYEGNPSPCHYH